MNSLLTKIIVTMIIFRNRAALLRGQYNNTTGSVQSPHCGGCGSRVEYDAYRCDLEELNLGPGDATSRTKLEQAERNVQSQRMRYLKSRDGLSTKLRLLEENKVRQTDRQADRQPGGQE